VNFSEPHREWTSSKVFTLLLSGTFSGKESCKELDNSTSYFLSFSILEVMVILDNSPSNEDPINMVLPENSTSTSINSVGEVNRYNSLLTLLRLKVIFLVTLNSVPNNLLGKNVNVSPGPRRLYLGNLKEDFSFFLCLLLTLSSGGQATVV